MGTPNSIVVRWRTDTATDSRVRYGGSPSTLNSFASNPTVTTEHEVAVTGLSPDTMSFYSVGTTTATLAGGDSTYFWVTFPPTGTPAPTRVWVLGDSGTANSSAIAVRDGYFNATGARHTDLWLMLGDNAYNSGTDAEYQGAVFNMYPTMLRKSVIFPALGNHDSAGATQFVDTYPYFSIFTLPRNGECGGLASGTEHYYSFDFGNLHFICLDSMTASRAPNGAMANWVQNDLAATTRDWIVAYWHHPPYTKGSHNSDSEIELVEMRQNILPILEAGGVDLVLSGHSHSYERSFLIDGHYGNSGTFGSGNVVAGGSGRDPNPYQKPSGLMGNAGAVYTVAGSSGQISGGTLNHPAMFVSLNVLGSVILDFTTNRLDLQFIDAAGLVRDSFAIVKLAVVAPPAPTGLTAAPGNNRVDLDWNASSGATSYNVKRATVSGGPYSPLATGVTTTSYADTTAVNGTTYHYVVSAVNAAGESPDSNQASATPAPPPPPNPPTGLAAAPGNNRVDLNWNASSGATSYNVKRATVSGGPYSTIATGVTTTSYADTTAVNGTTYFYVVSAVNSAGESLNSNQASATPAPPAPPNAPTALAARASGKKKIQLTWVQSGSPNVTQNRIYRSTISGGPYTPVATIPAATSYNNIGLNSGTTYYYVVTAINSSGLESVASSQASATAR